MKRSTVNHPREINFSRLFSFIVRFFSALFSTAASFFAGKYSRPLGLLFAKVQYGEMIADMRGKINGTVHSRNRAGAYMRNKVTPVNPQTTYQSTVRNRLAARAQAWRGLTQAQRDAWNSAVSNFQRTNIFGQLRTPSGINLYNLLNLNLSKIAQANITTPPLPTSVISFTSLSLTSSFGGPDIEIAFAAAISASQSVLVEATEPLSAGVNFVKSEYRVIDVLTNADATPVDLNAAYLAKFGGQPPVGSKIFVRVTQIVNANGISGIPLAASTIVAA